MRTEAEQLIHHFCDTLAKRIAAELASALKIEPDKQATQRKLATVDEVARYLQIPVGTLYHWRTKGEGPAAIRIGRYVRYRWDDVEDWLRNDDRRR